MDQKCEPLDLTFLSGNEDIEKAIHACYLEASPSTMLGVMTAIHLRMHENGHFLAPVDMVQDESGNECFDFKSIQLDENRTVLPLFTSHEEFDKAPPSGALSHFIDSLLTAVRDNEYFAGIMLNPWGESFLLTRECIELILAQGSNEPEPYIAQRSPYLDELDAMEQPYVNAHINNISFPTDIEGLEFYVYEHGHYNVEDILSEKTTNWTVPRSAKIGDIVLFYHAKTAIARITALITQVKALPENSGHDKPLLLAWLERARQLFKQYGGKIFAIARVSGRPEYWSADDSPNAYHWNGRVYADMVDVVVLETPIDISEFNSFITVSRQSAITPLPSKEFNGLRRIIREKNHALPEYFLKCEIGNFDLSHINSENFLVVTKEYRRRFLLEINFRSYYVDYLLKGFAKRKYWQECKCYASGKPHCRVDNVFQYKGKYYLLEVKLDIRLEKDLHGQLQQYIHADYLYLDKDATKRVDDFEREFMYVIDTEAFYIYEASTDTLTELIQLDNVHSIDDIKKHLR